MTSPGVGDLVGAVDGGLVLGTDGGFHPQGRLVVAGEPDGVLDASGLWVTPGFVDVHTHLSWTDFDAADRPACEPGRIAATARNQRATLRAGVTTARDAGGYDGGLRQRLADTPGPRLRLSIDIIGPADARGARHLRGRVSRLADAGADWIKVAATGGVGGDRQLDPVFTPAEFAAVAAAAGQAGLPLMVHAWGGTAVDQAIDLGVRSIEHAVFLTRPQARRAAAAGTIVVPTVWIYAEVLRLAEAGTLPAGLAAGARRAVDAHPAAVRHCLEEGVTIAMGTDAGLPSQHGRNLHEVAALIDVGVPPGKALLAATVTGARLLGEPAGTPFASGPRADLVLWDRDPRDPAVLRDPSAVVAVVQSGRLVHAGTATSAG